MSSKDRLTIVCPECKTEIAVDIPTGRILLHRAPPKKAESKNLEQLMVDLDATKKRAAQVFEQEISSLEDHDRIMEAKFQEAINRAKSEEEEEEKPLRPWDLD